MPKDLIQHPFIFLARENGWHWVIESHNGELRADELISPDLASHESLRDVAVRVFGCDADTFPTGDGSHQVATANGEVAYVVSDAEARALLIRRGADQAETAELALSAAHELANTPSAISGWAQFGLYEPSRMRDALLTVENAAASAQRVARDVLAFRGETDQDSCDVAAVCRDVASLLHPIALRHNVRVHTDTPSLAWTPAHRAAVFRVLWNLALNATQMQPDGGVVRIQCERNESSVRVLVADEGPGISEENQARIFTTGYSARPGGTGIGLATVRRTLERVGGQISLTSALGGGAQFLVQLPRALEQDERVSGVVLGELPRRLLVIEDDDGVRELIETTLGLRGIDVVAVVNSESALTVSGTFDVALADLTLPDGRGDSLLAQLRSAGVVRRTVITSGQLDPGTLMGPPDAWLPKPFDIHDLLAVLREVRPAQASASPDAE